MRHDMTSWTKKGCKHTGATPIRIGGYSIWLGAERDIKTLPSVDLILPLNGNLPRGVPFGKTYKIVSCTLQDFGGVPRGWSEFIHEIASQLRHGKRILAYCMGGHGRTGTLAASLIGLMEPKVENPVEEIRLRHCEHAVETEKQVRAVFAVARKPLPYYLKAEFEAAEERRRITALEDAIAAEKFKQGQQAKKNLQTPEYIDVSASAHQEPFQPALWGAPISAEELAELQHRSVHSMTDEEFQLWWNSHND